MHLPRLCHSNNKLRGSGVFVLVKMSGKFRALAGWHENANIGDWRRKASHCMVGGARQASKQKGKIWKATIAASAVRGAISARRSIRRHSNWLLIRRHLYLEHERTVPCDLVTGTFVWRASYVCTHCSHRTAQQEAAIYRWRRWQSQALESEFSGPSEHSRPRKRRSV